MRRCRRVGDFRQSRRAGIGANPSWLRASRLETGSEHIEAPATSGELVQLFETLVRLNGLHGRRHILRHRPEAHFQHVQNCRGAESAT
jgi:hypothetical protein